MKRIEAYEKSGGKLRVKSNTDPLHSRWENATTVCLSYQEWLQDGWEVDEKAKLPEKLPTSGVLTKISLSVYINQLIDCVKELQEKRN